MAKFYAVKKGKKTGIFHDWDECKNQVQGYPGAIYKSFTNLEEANNFLKNKNQENKKLLSKYTTYAFIDGSFDSENNIYGSGIVIINKDKKIRKKLANNNKKIAELRNVAGELEAAKYVMSYALENNIKEIAIYFDYMGIAAWACGDWKSNLAYTKEYAAFAQKIMQTVKIDFIKVKAHSGVELNEEVDKLAKEAIADFKKGNLAELASNPLNNKPNQEIKEYNNDFFFGEKEDLADIEKMKKASEKFEQKSFFE